MIRKNKKADAEIAQRVVILGIIISVLVFIAVVMIYKNVATKTEFSLGVKIPAYARDIQAATGCAVPNFVISFVEGFNYFSVPVDMSGFKVSSLCTATGVGTISSIDMTQTYNCASSTEADDFELELGKAYVLIGGSSFRYTFSGITPTIPMTHYLNSGKNYVGIITNCRLDFDEYFADVFEDEISVYWSSVIEYSRNGDTIENTPNLRRFNSFRPGLVYEINMNVAREWSYDIK